MTITSKRRNAGLLMLLVGGLTGTMTVPSLANLVQNGSFEIGPGGLGILPTDWFVMSQSPDTYIPGNGPLGADPAFVYGNSATAYDGVRWVGGLVSHPPFVTPYIETFGQTLSSTLTPGQQYTVSARLLESDSQVLTTLGSGGYEVWLGTSSGGTWLAGSLAPTTGPGSWQFRSFSFVAPNNAALLPVIEFRPSTAALVDESWPGIDAVTLDPVPEPGTVALLAVGLLITTRRRRRR